MRIYSQFKLYVPSGFEDCQMVDPRLLPAAASMLGLLKDDSYVLPVIVGQGLCTDEYTPSAITPDSRRGDFVTTCIGLHGLFFRNKGVTFESIQEAHYSRGEVSASSVADATYAARLEDAEAEVVWFQRVTGGYAPGPSGSTLKVSGRYYGPGSTLYADVFRIVQL